MACDGRIVCMCDWNCDCPNCADKPPSLKQDGGSSAQLEQSQFQSHIHTILPSQAMKPREQLNLVSAFTPSCLIFSDSKIISKQIKITRSIVEKDHNAMEKSACQDSNYIVNNLYILIRSYLKSRYSEKSTKILKKSPTLL